jgi:hypothetical protein
MIPRLWTANILAIPANRQTIWQLRSSGKHMVVPRQASNLWINDC